jgi:glutathione S-transferase
MKLYYHPASTTSRPIMLFAAETGLALDMQVVDLFTGEHMQPAYETVNPNQMVPVLDDGDFRLTESSAILKYLADKAGSPLYPKGLQERARVNESMDWVNTQLCRDLAYGLVYPQILPGHKRPSDAAQAAHIEWNRGRAQHWLKVLDTKLLAGHEFLCGDAMTIADYFASAFVSLAELTGSDLAAYPNVRTWLGRMKALKSWKAVNEAIDGYGASLKGRQMVGV